MHHTHPKNVSASYTRSAKHGGPVPRVRRQLKSRRLDTYSNELHGRPQEGEEEEGLALVGIPASGLNAPANLDEFIAEINENYIGCLRVTKASVEFGRMAGRKLHQARQSMGGDAFDRFVERELPLSQREASTLIRFSQKPEVCGADVLPTTAVSFTRASQLAGLLYVHDSAAT